MGYQILDLRLTLQEDLKDIDFRKILFQHSPVYASLCVETVPLIPTQTHPLLRENTCKPHIERRRLKKCGCLL